MPNSVWTESGNSTSVTIKAVTVDTNATAGSADYLTNADKIALMSQYTSELATKTQLDETASSLSVNSTTYDNAVAAINTTLVNAGAPSTWATTWPDGTTFGPVVGIKTLLVDAWSVVATQRTALLASISATQAAQAQIVATASAATDALQKANAALLKAPSLSTFSSAALPSLPSSGYPAGSCWITTDAKEYQVSTDGSAWNQVSLLASAIVGQLTASQVTIANYDNLIPNPYSEQAAPSGGWSSSAYEGHLLSADNPYQGAMCRKQAAGGFTAITPLIPCASAEQYHFEFYGMCSGSDAEVYVDWWAAGASSASSATVIRVTATSYALYSVTLTVPDGASNLQINLRCGSNSTLWADNFYLRRMTGANLIVDGAVTAKSLVLANFDNLFPNPNSEQAAPAGGWPSGAYEAVCLSTSNPYAGASCRAITGGNSANAADFTPLIACAAGDQFYFECYAMVSGSSGAAYINWYKADGAAIVSTNVLSTTSTSYAKLSGSVTAPSGAAFLRIRLWTAASTTLYADNFYLRRMADSNLIVDGSITASKLQVGAAVVDIEKVGSLTAKLIYFDDGFCLNTLEPGQAGADKTLSHIDISTVSETKETFIFSDAMVAIKGLSWTVSVQSTSDIFDISASITTIFTAYKIATLANLQVETVVDGNLSGAYGHTEYDLGEAPVANHTYWQNLAYLVSFTGLSVGQHTIQIYAFGNMSDQSIDTCSRATLKHFH